jgi:hypothetical protein
VGGTAPAGGVAPAAPAGGVACALARAGGVPGAAAGVGAGAGAAAGRAGAGAAWAAAFDAAFAAAVAAAPAGAAAPDAAAFGSAGAVAQALKASTAAQAVQRRAQGPGARCKVTGELANRRGRWEGMADVASGSRAPAPGPGAAGHAASQLVRKRSRVPAGLHAGRPGGSSEELADAVCVTLPPRRGWLHVAKAAPRQLRGRRGRATARGSCPPA